MDKNMINIDDFVRQRLADGEEKEPAGAWLNMKDLLDNNMPENNPIGFNWKRMFGIASILVLLSFFTIGGYHYINEYRNNQKDVMVASTEKSAGNVSIQPTITNKEIHDQTSADKENNKPLSTLKSLVSKNENDKIISVNFSNTQASSNSTIVTTTHKTNKISKDSKVLDVNAGNNNKQPKEKIVVVNKDPKDIAKAGERSEIIKETSTTPIAISNNGDNNKTQKKSSNIKPDKKEKQNLNKIKSVKENKVAAIEKPVLQIPNAGSVIADKTMNVKKTDLNQEKLSKDSMNKMVIIQRYVIDQNNRTRSYINDTISIQKVALDKNILSKLNPDENAVANNKNSSSLSNKHMNPNGLSLSANNNADPAMKLEMVPLSNYKVNSKRTAKWNTRSYNDVVRDVKYNLSQLRFYSGISVGGNSNFGANNLSGVQFGLFGLVTFGENWNMMAEMKYMYHFNNGSVLEDDYMDIKPNTSSQLIQSKVEHFFKFSSLQSLELPIAIRYAAGRINLFGGINMTYNFRVNAEEVTLTPNDSSYKVVTNPNYNNSKPTVSYDDFKSRFSLGYLLGMSYALSPSLQVDMRMTKNVWDNAMGNGAEKVSSQYFKAPSIQFSLFYRFSQRNNNH